MLRTIKSFETIAFRSRAIGFRTSLEPRIAQYGYTTQADELQKRNEIKEKKIRDNIRKNEDLCIMYIREKNVAKIEGLTRNCILGDYVHHSIINMHIDMGSTERAINHLTNVRKSRPNFILDRSEAVRLAHVMYKEEREWREIVRVFQENKQPRPYSANVAPIYDFLRTVTDAGNPAELNELFSVLTENNFLVRDNQSVGYLVKVHLVIDDLTEAVRAFEKQFNERKFTSHHLPLAMALIKANDMEKLRTVFTMMRSKYSEANALLTLVTAFIKVDRIDLARVLLANTSHRISDDEFHGYWARYHKYGEYFVLQGLLDATAGSEYDRSSIYSYLLIHYCDHNQTVEALNLWHKQRARNEEPTVGFLQRLAAHLNENNVKVPFSVPEIVPAIPQLHALPAQTTEMRNALRDEDEAAAVRLWANFSAKSARYEYLASGLIQLLSKGKSHRIKDAVDIAMQVLDVGKRVSDTALGELTQRLVDDGNTDQLERLGARLSLATKRNIHFGDSLLEAYEKCGKWNAFFKKTLGQIDLNTNVNSRLRMINLLSLLQKQSIPTNEFRDFAEKAAEKNELHPLNVLWAHHFLNNSSGSRDLYQRFEKYYPEKFEIVFLGDHLTELEDDEKLEELVEFAKTIGEKHLPALKVIILVARKTKSKFFDGH